MGNFTDYLMGYRPESRDFNYLEAAYDEVAEAAGTSSTPFSTQNNPTPALYKNENGTAGDGGLYTIAKVWTQDHDYISTMSGYYDTRYRFTVDRNIPWDGTAKVEHMDSYLTAFAGEKGDTNPAFSVDRSNENGNHIDSPAQQYN